MAGDAPYRPELVAAFLRYAGLKGGDIGQVVPVVVLDNIGGGPYPTSRIYQLGSAAGPTAAQFSYCGIMNNDPVGVLSSVVIDRILVRTVAADDWRVVQTNLTTTAGLAVGSSADDLSNERDRDAKDRPRLGTILQVQGTLVASFSTGVNIYPIAAGSAVGVIEGPFTLGPQAVLLVSPQTVNVLAQAMFRGRYYGGT